MKSNIVLIGMPGAGKSTVGVLLAKSLGKRFVDTDLEIQHTTGKRLQEIIDSDGIESFLKTEEQTLAALNCENSVIATGGSAVFSENGMKRLLINGTAVFIDVPFEEIERRINNITTRGIAMKQGETLKEVYNERLALYKKYADITVASGNASAEETVEEIIKKCSDI